MTVAVAVSRTDLSRAADVPLDTDGANRCVALRRLVPEASVVDVTVAAATTIVTSDAADFTRLADHLDTQVVIAVI